MNEVFSWSLGFILIWLYPEKASIKLRSSWPAMASTIRSIRGRGKLSFGQALLTSMKSMQSRHLSFAFLTRTTLANKSGYSTSRIALAWRSLLTSSLIAFCLSRLKLFLFCLTGLKAGLMFSLCVIIAGSIPPISSCFQANNSIFYFKKWISRSLTPLANLDLM